MFIEQSRFDLKPVEVESNKILILQCRKCNYIIGDTVHLLTVDTQGKTLSLYRKPIRINMGNQLFTGSRLDEVNYESTWINLNCGSCDAPVGYQYKATPPEISHLLLSFTIKISEVYLYQVGSEIDVKCRGPLDGAKIEIPAIVKDIERLQKLFVYCYQAIERLDSELVKIKNSNGENIENF